MRIVGFFPNMAGVGSVKDILLVKKTADAARCLFDFEGSRGIGEFGGEVGKADVKRSVSVASRARNALGEEVPWLL